LGNVTATNAGSYYAVASNSAGSVTSNTVTLTVTTGAATNQVVTAGHDVSLAAPAADGQYQWQISTNSGASWTDLTPGAAYSGVQSATLTITSAGTGLNGAQYRYSIDTAGGTATSAGITLNVAAALIPFPVGIAADGSGNLYVTDNSTHIVQKITAANAVTTFAGTSGQTGTADGTGTAARFNQPNGIAATTGGELTVADTANGTIRRLTAAGVVTTLAGSSAARGNADTGGSSTSVDPGEVPKPGEIPAASATFGMPIGLSLDASGNVYVADATNHTIRKLTAGSSYSVSTFAGAAGGAGATDGTGSAARFNYPTGIAVDSAGNVYVADTTNNLIRKITPGGAVTTLAGVVGVSGATDGSGSEALFNQPQGLAVDGAGNLYVADTGNSVIRKIAPGGAVSTLAGLPTIGGLKDGAGNDAWFNQPRALTVDGDGTIYVADTGNAAIRKVTPAGVVTTLALTAGSTPPSGGGTSTGSGGGGSTPPSSGGGSGGGGGGGGGGAPSAWFLGAVALLAGLRWLRLRP
jgi:sugar lactone lactonase YvrE